MNILHLTDCHLHDSSQTIKAGYNTYESLQSVVNLAINSGLTFDVVVASGDISQTPSKISYDHFQQLTSTLPTPLLAIPGNHDDASLLSTVTTCPVDYPVYTVINDVLFLLMNSQVKNQEYGRIQPSDFSAIEVILKKHQNLPTIVILHHPPVITGSRWMDKIALQNKNEFIELLANYSHVKAILFGHVHQEIDVQHQHMRILGTPSTCYQFKPGSELVEYDNKKPGFRFVKLNQSGEVETTIYRIS